MVKADDSISVTFSRSSKSNKIYYTWSVQLGNKDLKVYNENGEVYSLPLETFQSLSPPVRSSATAQ